MPTDEPTDEPEPADEAGSGDGDGLVALSDQTALDPDATAIRVLVTQYFQAINTRDYALYYALHTVDAQASLDPDTFQRGYESTEDSGATLVRIGARVDGPPTAELTFTNRQESVDGPNGDTCNQWDITLFLRHEGGELLIGTPPNSYHAGFVPC